MPPSPDGESALVTSATKPKEVFKDKIVGENVVGTADHLKRHYFVHSVWSQHLDATTFLSQDLFLEISKRNSQPDVKRFQINPNFSRGET